MSKASGLILETKSVPSKLWIQTESQFQQALRQEGWKHAEKCVPWLTRDTPRRC